MFNELDPLLLSQLRLAIMAHLMVVRETDFNTLKTQTGATAGNLSAQISKLQEAGYIEVEKTFKNNYPLTLCKLSPKGVEAFETFYANLKSYFDNHNGG
ncbi:MAG: transcriptional regulator [Saprospiraceae bacterium]|jgi:DNA-binding MarR family transcriptional regulator|nr:transcriptional regulator [Lewinellaceae bacterium]